MLTRVRIEVSDEDSAAACSDALDKYEHWLQTTEASRYRMAKGGDAGPTWRRAPGMLPSYAEELGREVTDEVIEYDASLPGYKGRRVVQFRRIDTRRPQPETGETAAKEARSRSANSTHGHVTVSNPGPAYAA